MLEDHKGQSVFPLVAEREVSPQPGEFILKRGGKPKAGLAPLHNHPHILPAEAARPTLLKSFLGGEAGGQGGVGILAGQSVSALGLGKNPLQEPGSSLVGLPDSCNVYDVGPDRY